jgi:hypothetical protein
MKITMLRNAAKQYECGLSEGETGTVPADLAERLIADGIAVAVDVAEKPVKAVAKPPEIKGEAKESK